jgi:hypothetical protein
LPGKEAQVSLRDHDLCRGWGILDREREFRQSLFQNICFGLPIPPAGIEAAAHMEAKGIALYTTPRALVDYGPE